MRTKYLLIGLIIMILAGCKKETQPNNPAPPPPQNPPVLLKEIVIPNLPSPYYHFEYDATGKPSFVSFASDFTRYDIVYDGGRISELRNNILVNKDTVRYHYDNAGRAVGVDYIDLTGTVYIKVSLTYSGQQLISLERKRLLGPDFVVNKTMTFSYYADGNLKEIVDHRPAVNGQQPESTSIDRFEQYDNKINVDAFGLLHNDFFDHLVLLPGIQLQKNNPGKETFTSDGLNFTVDYTYTYNDKNLPLNKKGDLLFTSGPDAGQHFEINTFYSYY